MLKSELLFYKLLPAVILINMIQRILAVSVQILKTSSYWLQKKAHLPNVWFVCRKKYQLAFEIDYKKVTFRCYS